MKKKSKKEKKPQRIKTVLPVEPVLPVTKKKVKTPVKNDTLDLGLSVDLSKYLNRNLAKDNAKLLKKVVEQEKTLRKLEKTINDYQDKVVLTLSEETVNKLTNLLEKICTSSYLVSDEGIVDCLQTLAKDKLAFPAGIEAIADLMDRGPTFVSDLVVDAQKLFHFLNKELNLGL